MSFFQTQSCTHNECKESTRRCDHYFCLGCITDWQATRGPNELMNCPYCRAPKGCRVCTRHAVSNTDTGLLSPHLAPMRIPFDTVISYNGFHRRCPGIFIRHIMFWRREGMEFGDSDILFFLNTEYNKPEKK